MSLINYYLQHGSLQQSAMASYMVTLASFLQSRLPIHSLRPSSRATRRSRSHGILTARSAAGLHSTKSALCATSPWRWQNCLESNGSTIYPRSRQLESGQYDKWYINERRRCADFYFYKILHVQLLFFNDHLIHLHKDHRDLGLICVFRLRNVVLVQHLADLSIYVR